MYLCAEGAAVPEKPCWLAEDRLRYAGLIPGGKNDVLVSWLCLGSCSCICSMLNPVSLRVQGKSDDFEIAAAQIGVEVYSAMNSAIG